MPELVRTSLSWLSPESLSATADLLSSDLAYHQIKFKFKTKQLSIEIQSSLILIDMITISQWRFGQR